MQKVIRTAMLLVLTGTLLLSAGCVSLNMNSSKPGELMDLTERVTLDQAESLDANINMGAGELRIAGGADDLLEAAFLYNNDAWKPIVGYTESGRRGRLRVEQPAQGSTLSVGDIRYEWNLVLNNEIPTDLAIKMGAGKGRLDLRGLHLTAFDMEIGAGDVSLDFSGHWEQGFNANLKGGVGKATLYVPASAGVRIDVSGGIGAINTTGLVKNGNSYSNEAYDDAAVILTFDVKAGIGEINLIVKE